jgi:hypothetical protein
LTTAFISKTIIVDRPQTTFFILTYPAQNCQGFKGFSGASLFYIGRVSSRQ